jgi:uncharacterized lipoprotein
MTLPPVLRSFRWLIAAGCALPLLAGCGLASKLGITPGVDTCRDAQAYESAPEAPALQVPAGLDSPSARGALKIPVLEAPERKRAAGEPCLDQPPTYYPGRPRPTAAKKKK